MRLKMYGTIIINSIKRTPFINTLIVIQMMIVFAVGIIMSSAIEEKANYYEAVEPLINGDGLYCGGYFLQDSNNGGLLNSTEKIKSNLKNIDFISTVNFSSLQLGVNSVTNEIEVAYVLIYDEYAANLYTPIIEDGVWITKSNDSDKIAQAVITQNCLGYKSGDVVSFETDSGTVKVRIIGVIGDNEKYLGANADNESKEPSYQSMLSQHFNSLNDELKNKGYSDEKIAENIESLGYSKNFVVYNEPVIFFLDKEWKKTGEDAVMSDSLYIRYNENISNDEKLYNRKFVNEQMPILSFAIRFSQLRENSLDIVYGELYTLFPIQVAVFLLVLIGSVSVNLINCKNNMRNNSILYLSGARKKNLLFISVIYNALICGVSMIITVAGVTLLSSSKFKGTVIACGWKQLIICLIVFLVYIVISCIVPYIMLTEKSINKALKSKER